MKKKKLSGVMPALVTPMDAKGEIDFVAFKKHLAMLRAAGVTGWVPCGSTGEYNFLSDAEREQVLQFVKDFALPTETLIAGTNAPHTKGVIANTKRAKEIGSLLKREDDLWKIIRSELEQVQKQYGDARRTQITGELDEKEFTADDFIFWFEDIYGNPEIVPTPTPEILLPRGPDRKPSHTRSVPQSLERQP